MARLYDHNDYMIVFPENTSDGYAKTIAKTGFASLQPGQGLRSGLTVAMNKPHNAVNRVIDKNRHPKPLGSNRLPFSS